MAQDIDLERIAALLEGSITGEERARLLRALADSPEAAELYAEAAAVQAELDQGTAPAAPTSAAERGARAPRFRWVLASLPLAAALAALLIIPRANRPTAPLTLRGDAGWLAGSPDVVAARLDPGWSDPVWQATRGGTAAGELDAFRAGVRLVDLEVARQTRQDGVMRQVSASLRALMEAAPQGAVAAAQYDRAVQEGINSEAIDDAVGATVSLLRENPRFRLGLWTEQARLAARADDLAFFRANGRPHEELRNLIASSGASIPAAATQALTDIEAIIASGRGGQSAVDIQERVTAVMRVVAEG